MTLFELSPTPTTGALILRDGISNSIGTSTGPACRLSDGSTNDFGAKSVAVDVAVGKIVGLAVGVKEAVTDGTTVCVMVAVAVAVSIGSPVGGINKDG